MEKYFSNTAIILAGGKSTRNVYNKELIKINGEYLIYNNIKKLKTLFEEIIVVSNNKDFYKDQGVRVVSDELLSNSPLAGIHIGLKSSKSKYNYILAVDMPVINVPFIKYMKSILTNHDAYVVDFGKYREPFNAFYSKDIVLDIEAQVNKSDRSIQALIKRVNSFYISKEIAKLYSIDLSMFKNVNNVKDLD